MQATHGKVTKKEVRLQLRGRAHHLDFYDLLPVETSDAYEIDSINNWH